MRGFGDRPGERASSSPLGKATVVGFTGLSRCPFESGRGAGTCRVIAAWASASARRSIRRSVRRVAATPNGLSGGGTADSGRQRNRRWSDLFDSLGEVEAFARSCITSAGSIEETRRSERRPIALLPALRAVHPALSSARSAPTNSAAPVCPFCAETGVRLARQELGTVSSGVREDVVLADTAPTQLTCGSPTLRS